MKKDWRDFFWPSYVDLLTGLFIVMLVLFILSYKLLGDKLRGTEYKLQRFTQMQRIDKQISELNKSSFFEYQDQFKRHILKAKIIFDPNQSIIKNEYKSELLEAGKALHDFLDSIFVNNEKKVKFLVVIEGNAANTFDNLFPKDSRYGYRLSYERALSLYKFWSDNKILRSGDPKFEVLIAGSGFSGVGRDTLEDNNKRFIVQILPKLGEK